jgi:hypothetical protein
MRSRQLLATGLGGQDLPSTGCELDDLDATLSVTVFPVSLLSKSPCTVEAFQPLEIVTPNRQSDPAALFW